MVLEIPNCFILEVEENKKECSKSHKLEELGQEMNQHCTDYTVFCTLHLAMHPISEKKSTYLHICLCIYNLIYSYIAMQLV